MAKYKYYEAFIYDSDYPNEFYRRFLVRDDLNIEEFCAVITTYLFTAVYHIITFETSRYVFENRFCDFEHRPDRKADVFQKDYTIEFLRNRLYHKKEGKNTILCTGVYTYDTGENYEFIVNINFKDPKFLTVNKTAILKEGKGYMIFEDSKNALNEYISSKYDKKVLEEKFGEDWEPLNSFMYQDFFNDVSEFNKPLDIDLINKKFPKLYKQVLNAYKLEPDHGKYY